MAFTDGECIQDQYVQSAPADPWIYELTVTNTNGTGQTGFVPVYKLKGVQPQGAWYYGSGYGDQEFTFTTCTVVAAMADAGRAPLTPGERRGARIG